MAIDPRIGAALNNTLTPTGTNWVPPKPPLKRVPPAPGKTTVSEQDLVEQAKRIVQQITAPLQTQAQGLITAGNRQASNTMDVYKALAEMQKGQVGDVQNAYQTAAGTTASFSKGYSDAMQASLNGQGADINSFLQNVVGAPQGQMLDPAKNTAAGDAVYGITGVIPGSALAAQGAAAKTYALGLAPQSLKAGISAGELIKGDARTAFNKAIEDIIGKTPGLVQSTLADLVKQQQTAEKAKADAAYRAAVLKQNDRKITSSDNAKKVAALVKQADQMSKTGFAFTYDATQKKIVPVLDDSGEQMQTTPGITAQASLKRLDLDIKKTLQATTNTQWAKTDKGWVDTGVPTGDQLNKERSFSQRDRSLSQADARIGIAQQNVQLANQRLLLSGDNSARAAAQFMADQLSKGTNEDGSKTIYTVQRTKNGWQVATATNPNTGKPLTAKDQGFTPSQERKLKVDAAVVAKSAKNGITSKPGAPAFFDANGAPVTVKPNDPSKGWSQLVPGSNPPVYINHYPPISYDDAAQKLIVDGQYPPALAYEALNREYKPGEQGRPGSSPGNRRVASGYSLSNVGMVPSNVKVASGVSVQTVDNRLLESLGALQQQLGVDVQIISGYRTKAQQAAAYQRYVESGFDPSMIAAKPGLSNHEYGQAVDVLVNGKAIGDVIPADVLAKFGLHNPVKGDGPHTTLLDVNG